jgi:hypothetical protein
VNGDEEIAARGEIRAGELARPHHEGFDHALNRALAALDGSKYAGKELIVRQSIVITENPGGVGQYHVELVTGG